MGLILVLSVSAKFQGLGQHPGAAGNPDRPTTNALLHTDDPVIAVRSAEIVEPPHGLLPAALDQESDQVAAASDLLVRQAHEALARGAFQEATDLLSKALSLEPAQEDTRRALAEAFSAWGWNRIADAAYEDAVNILARGLRAAGEHGSALAGLGYAYAQLRRDRDAIAVLTRAAEIEPSNRRVHELLGELYNRQNDLDRAVAALRTASELDPDDASLAARAARLARERDRQDPFVQAVTRHFTIQFDGRESRDLHRTALSVLEEAYGEVGRAVGFFPAEATTVILYSHQQFQDITRSPQWTGAVFDGKIRVPTDGYETRPDLFRRVLYHEYVHALIHAKTRGPIGQMGTLPAPRVPVWLHEGLAQYFEPSSEQESVGELLRAAALRNRLMPLRLLEGSFMSLTSEQAALAYAQSRSVVAFFIDRYGLNRVVRLLEELARQQSLDAACREALGLSSERLQRAWDESLLASIG